MTKETKKTALITGASGGIGYELSKQFAADGIDLVVVSRNATRLEQVAGELKRDHGINVRVLPKDLSRPKAPQEIFDELEADGVIVDALVNNAGIGNYGRFAEIDLKDEIAVMQVNMMALTALTRLFLSGMVKRGRGNILNLSSIAAYQTGGPRMAVYYATKAFVQSFSRALSVELRGTGVHVTALGPGATKTDLIHDGDMAKTLAFSTNLSSPAMVARKGYRAMKRNLTTYVPGLFNKILALAGELPPRQISLEVNNLLLKPGR